MTLAFAVTLVGLGFIGAFISGLVGVGGAIIMIPLLLYVPPLLAVGSLDIKLVAGATMTQVLVASLIGAWTHGRKAMVHRSLAVTGGIAMALGSLIGAVASRYVTGEVLLAMFALMTTLALPLMFVPTTQTMASGPEGPFSRIAAIAYPGTIGIMSGMVGAGGAFLLVPVLIAFMGIPVRLTIGTSLAMTGVSASMGFLGKLLTAQVPFWPAVALVVGSVSGAPLGAAMSRLLPVGVLRTVLALLIALVAIRVWADLLLR